jgi:hypothetical protein
MIISIVTYQSLKIRSYNVKTVLFEIIVTSLVFHLIYQLPFYGLYGTDSYVEATIANNILIAGHTSQPFPNVNIFGAQLSMVTGIDISNIAKWVPSLIDTVLIIISYLLVNFIFKKREIALLSTLLLACLQDNILFGSLFVDETLALILMACCIYFIFTAEKHNRFSAYLLSGVLVVAMIFSHHLTSFLFVVFLSTYFILSKISNITKIKNLFFKEVTKINISLFYILFASISLFVYWLYTADYPIVLLADFAKNFLSFGQWGASSYSALANESPGLIATIGGYILYYGFFFFVITFGMITLFSLIRWARGTKLEIFSFTFFLYICGLIGIIGFFVSNITVYPDRLLAYGWLFGFSPLVWAIVRKRSKFFKVGIILLVAFMIFNIYSIDSTTWSPNSNMLSASPSVEDYVFAQAFPLPSENIAAFTNTAIVLEFVQNIPVTDFSNIGKVNISNFNLVVIDKNALKIEQNSPTYSGDLAQLSQLENGSFISDKLYASNSLSVWSPNNN